MTAQQASGSTRELLARIEATITPLHGWGTVAKGMRLAELVLETRADVSVEIGVFGGRGVIPMAIAHHIQAHGYAVGIDPWERAASLEGENSAENEEWWAKVDHDAIYEHFIRALVQADVVRQCRVMRERSDTALRLFADASIAVLHQDGNHSELLSAREARFWGPKLRPGGYWVADDTDWPTTHRAQAILVEQCFVLVEDYGKWRVYRKP